MGNGNDPILKIKLEKVTQKNWVANCRHDTTQCQTSNFASRNKTFFVIRDILAFFAKNVGGLAKERKEGHLDKKIKNRKSREI